MAPTTTTRLTVPSGSIATGAGRHALARAAEVLRSGGTVAFPTETVYGLGANALDAKAVEGIFLAKQRPSWDPLIVHVSDAAMLDTVVTGASEAARRLMAAFWPGPLTLLLPRQPAVPDAVTAGRPLVAVRMPVHPVARALITAAGVPVAAPSANRFGHTSPTTAQHVLDDLDGRIDLLLDGGPAWCGMESTVIEVADRKIVLYRPGAVPVEEIEAVAGPVILYLPPENQNVPTESLPSPGVGMRHYAPNASVVPIEVGNGAEIDQQAQWLRAVRELSATHANTGVMLPTGWPLPETFTGQRYEWGAWGNDRELAQRFFTGLRALDAMEVERILCAMPAASGLGAAIQDRLLKAARKP